MASTRYPQSDQFIIIQNGTANSYDFTIEKKDETIKTMTVLPGTSLMFKDVKTVVMDSADYANISVKGYDDTLVGFFLT